MTKTKVKSHARKGTKGVKTHTRKKAKSKTVPHISHKAPRIPVKKLIDSLDLEFRDLDLHNFKTGDWKELNDFDDIPKTIRNKEWDFIIKMDRNPVEESTEFRYIEITGRRALGKVKRSTSTGIDLATGKFVPTDFKTFKAYEEIKLDTQMNWPVDEFDTDTRKKIEKETKALVKSNFTNPANKIKVIWEDN